MSRILNNDGHRWIDYSTNSPEKRASRASALRAGKARHIRGLVLTQLIGPTHWTRPERPHSWDSPVPIHLLIKDKCLKLTRPHVNRCGECEGCKRTENCGECRSCLDRPEFGGPGLTHKKTCKKRKCQKLVKETENDMEKEIKTCTSGVVTKTFFPRLKF